MMLQALLLGAALLVAPGLLDSPVDLPKRLWIEGVVMLGWLGWLAAGLEQGRLAWRPSALVAPAIGLVGIVTASALGAANPAQALEAAGFGLALAALALLASGALPDAGEEAVLNAALLAAGLEALYGILQYAGIEFLPWASSWGSRCFGTLGNPIFFAEFLAPLFVVGVARWLAEEDEERKDLHALLVLTVFLALLFAQTRSAWLGAAGGAAVLVAGLARAVPGGRALLGRNRTWLLAFGGFAVAVALTVSSPAVFGKGALPIRDRLRDMVDRKGWTVRHRLVLWRAGLVMAREAPLLGAGPDQYGSRFPLAQAAFRDAAAQAGFFFAPKEQKAHNDYVQDLAETGVLGLGAWLWVLAVVWRCGGRAMRGAMDPGQGAVAAGLLGGCVALILDAGFNFPFRILPVAAIFWLCAGRLAARGGAGGELRTGARLAEWPRPRRRLAAAAAAAGACVWIGHLTVPSVRADRNLARATAYLGSNFYEMAEDALAESLALRPGDAYAHYLAGTALEKTWTFDWTGRTLDRALEHYLTARRLGLNDELLYAHLALVYEKKGQLDRAILAGEEAVRIFPESGDHASNLAYWYATRHRSLDRALGLADGAVASVPRHPLYHWSRGLVLEALGRPREALGELDITRPLLPNVQNGAGYLADLATDTARVRAAAGRDQTPRRPMGVSLQTF